MKVLFFAPHSGIWIHAFPEALVAEALVQAGHDVVYVTCGGTLRSGCVVMSAIGQDFRTQQALREQTCAKCTANRDLLRREFAFRGTDLAAELTADDEKLLAALLADATPENYLTLTVEGIPVGRIALYEFLLGRKKNTLVLSDPEWTEYRIALGNTVRSALASLRILRRERPDRVVTYNSFYSVNHACCLAADREGVPHYLLHAGPSLAGRYGTLTLTRGYSYNFLTRHPRWPRFRDRPCSSRELAVVTEHMLELLRARSVFVYSAPKSARAVDVRAAFGIAPGQKVLVATMSSHDERFAAVTVGVMPVDGQLLFPTQLEWIQALVKYVADRPDLFLLIRVHPREFPNKREQVTSAYASRLQEALATLPVNVRVNWPADGISLYDLACYIDVVLNCRSTTGFELGVLGIPVVVYSPQQLFAYPAEINLSADDEADYYRCIEQALAAGWSIENCRRAWRWGAFQYVHATLDISDGYSGRRSMLARVAGRIGRRLHKQYDQRRDCRRRARRLRTAGAITRLLEMGAESVVDVTDAGQLPAATLDEETSALRRELARILAALGPGASTTPLGRHIAAFIDQHAGRRLS